MSTDINNNHNSLKDNPFKVPNGYFEDFSAKVMARLPDYPVAQEKPLNLSVWKRIMPYVALAAMFAGIWCMMKIFHVVSQPSYSLDNPPEAVVLAMNDPDTYDFYSGDFMADSHSITLSDPEMEDEIQNMYSDMDDLEKDLGITLKPEYENIKIETPGGD